MQATLTTTVATASAMIAWLIIDIAKTGKPTLVGVCTGTLCGLVGITPAAGYVTIAGAFFIGIVATLASYTFVNYLKPRLGVDDALDAFGCHGVSGIIGSLATGLLATKTVNPDIAKNGLFYGGGWSLFGSQLIATVVTIVFVTVMVSLIVVVLRIFIKMRVSRKEEVIGLDIAEHGETVDYAVTLDEDIRKYEDEFSGQLARLKGKGKQN